MSFLEGLIQAKPPLNPFVDAETNLSVFISLLLPKVHFLKVTRVVTLAPPMKFTPTTQLSGGTFLHGGHTKINQAFHACRPWRLSLSGLPGGAVLRITDADANNWLPRALRSALAHWRYRRHNPPPPQPQPPHKRRRK